MTPRRMLAKVGLCVLATGFLLSVMPGSAGAGWFGCKDGHCKLCPYGAKLYCTAPCPCLLNECNGYFPTQWHPWPCPQQHVPPIVVPPAGHATPPANGGAQPAPARIMPPVR